MDPDLDPSFQRKAQKVLTCAQIPYILACHLQIDVDPDPVPYPAYHCDVGPDADPDPDFYLMRMRIQVTKMMRMRTHNTDSIMPVKVFSIFAVARILVKEFKYFNPKNGF